MAAFLLDSSAAVKCYVVERGTGWMLDLVEPGHRHEVLVAAVTPVEVVAALYRRVRSRTLSAARAAEG